MADRQSSTLLPSRVGGSLSRKKLPSLPQHIHLWAVIKRWNRRLFYRWWTWELVAASVMIAATIGLIALLAQANQRPQETWAIGNTQLTLNTLVVAISTIMRSALMLAVGGALNQSLWNWFADDKKDDSETTAGRQLKDFEIFGDASANAWNSARLLYRIKGRYVMRHASYRNPQS